VGTPKRERQKANRQQRLEEMAAERKKQDMKKSTVKWGSIIGALAVAIVVIAVVSTRNNDKKVSTAASTTTIDGAVTTIAGDPTTTIEGATTTTAPAGPVNTVADPTPCPKADGSEARVITFKSPPPMCIDPAKKYSAVVTTNKGSYTAVLDAVKAPKTVNNFVVLARYHYFDKTNCHRIIPGFMAQCGDPGNGPGGPGTGGPGYDIPDELPKQGDYKIGSLVMANTGKPNSGGSQFFFVTGAQGVSLPPTYAMFGQVDEKDPIVKALDAAGNPSNNGVPPKEAVIIEKVEIKES
jgi:cyclophilin family peptidyl-prolyl cis-trans isomerase